MAEDDDNHLYELAEDPDEPSPPPKPAAPDPRLGVAGAKAGAGAESPGSPKAPPEPAPDDDLMPDPDEPPKGSSGPGGEGAASHFSGEDPEYVNPEIARLRREDQRRARAAEEAAEAAVRMKIKLGIASVLLVALVVGYFLLVR